MSTPTRSVILCLGAGIIFSMPIWSQQVMLRADAANFQEVTRQIPLGGRLLIEELQLDPLSPPKKVRLKRFSVFARDAKLIENTAQGPIEHPIPNTFFFQGRIEDQNKAIVYMSVQEEGQISGVITHKGRYWLLAGGQTQGAPANGIAAVEADALDLQHISKPFQCLNDSLSDKRLPLPGQTKTTSLTPTKGNASYTGANFNAVIAVDSDFEYFSLFGSSISALTHASNLVGFASTVFSEEINISLSLGITTIWSTAGDPWDETEADCALFEFGQFWNNGQSGVDRTVAHFLSGKKAGGGIAWTDVLCGDAFLYDLEQSCPNLSPRLGEYGGDFGFSGNLTGVFNPNNPAFLWDIYVFMHEIGHNFNSPHTHCYSTLGGNPNPIDQCSSAECGTDNCYCGGTTLPCANPGEGCGTIMSYCQRLNGDLGNISLTFGMGHPHGIAPERVPQRMSQAVISAHQMNPQCIPADTTLADLLEDWPLTVNIFDMLPFVY